MDAKLLSDCVRGSENSWGNFLLKTLAQNQISSKFPLTPRAIRFCGHCVRFVPDRPGSAGNRRNHSCRRASQPVGDARPFRHFRRRLHNDQLRARLVATVQLRINRPRKRLRIVRNDAHAREIFRRRNVGVGDDVSRLKVEG